MAWPWYGDAIINRRPKSLGKTVKENHRLNERLNEQLTHLTTTLQQANNHMSGIHQVHKDMRNLGVGMKNLFFDTTQVKDGVQLVGNEMLKAKHDMQVFSACARGLFDEGTEGVQGRFVQVQSRAGTYP
ncbi:hypothetical protein QBC41DRAFT_348244 [Cercophora samala]|uniref:Uncharacterized protein n=1 Tax=Cercophora samala TaxID=330535 RepID=A0AA39ZA98_9PEZI|nr:hypothetical protein QBC41DRAFT_348244 [Cercophora samala]